MEIKTRDTESSPREQDFFAMTTVTIERTIDQTLPTVWGAFADFGGVARFHPFVQRSPLGEGTPAQGVGAERVCHFYDGNHVRERVLRSEDMRSMEVEITEGSMPLRSAVALIELSPTSEGQTRVSMSMTYEPKMGVLGKVMDALMMRRKFGQMLGLVLAGLDEHLRTGQTIERDFRPAAAAA